MEDIRRGDQTGGWSLYSLAVQAQKSGRHLSRVQCCRAGGGRNLRSPVTGHLGASSINPGIDDLVVESLTRSRCSELGDDVTLITGAPREPWDTGSSGFSLLPRKL